MANIQQYHGEVTKCGCGIADQPAGNSERACRFCFGRGFVAECNSCGGSGQLDQKMAGGPGTMKSTCIPCGGVGMFGVNRPADWIEPVQEVEPAKEEVSALAE